MSFMQALEQMWISLQPEHRVVVGLSHHSHGLVLDDDMLILSSYRISLYQSQICSPHGGTSVPLTASAELHLEALDFADRQCGASEFYNWNIRCSVWLAEGAL